MFPLWSTPGLRQSHLTSPHFDSKMIYFTFEKKWQLVSWQHASKYVEKLRRFSGVRTHFDSPATWTGKEFGDFFNQ
jgi:hypothetical protein